MFYLIVTSACTVTLRNTVKVLCGVFLLNFFTPFLNENINSDVPLALKKFTFYFPEPLISSVYLQT